jgi:hypothetical protein
LKLQLMRCVTEGIVASILVLSQSFACGAQGESSSDPAMVLRNILMASCSQNSRRFNEYLTARNATAFATMTPAAQMTLLKRFVLIDEIGNPRAQVDAAGNPSVFCVTPGVTTQLQIGKPEIRDNVAYLPLVVKDVTDTADANTRRVVMGLVRENSQWKLLSLGLLLLDLPTLAEEWDRAEIQNNEKSAVASIKELAVALEKYRVTYARLPQSLADLGPPATGAPKSDHAGLVDAETAAGRKDGYSFRFVIVGANEVGAPAIYQLAAIPIEYGRTGNRSFFRDGTGTVHGGDHQGAVGTILDPKIE